LSHIFISYKSDDHDYAQAVAKALRANSYTVWIDARNISGTDDWQNEIQAAIDQAYLVMIIMTPAAEQSPWVRREKNYAEQSKKPILPLLRLGGLWFSLNNIQFIDVRNAPLSDPLPARVYAALLRHAPIMLPPSLTQSAQNNDPSLMLRMIPDLTDLAENVYSPQGLAARRLLADFASQPDTRIGKMAQAALTTLPPLPDEEQAIPPSPPLPIVKPVKAGRSRRPILIAIRVIVVGVVLVLSGEILSFIHYIPASNTPTIQPIATTSIPLVVVKPSDSPIPATNTNTAVPTTFTAVPTKTLIPPTNTNVPPTPTPIPPTLTPIPPTKTFTPIPLTNTNVPPTPTPIPPTLTSIPPTPTLTSIPPTNTNVPPTATPIPPTLTSVPPTMTPLPPTTVTIAAGTTRTDSFGILQVYVPVGCFKMGSDPTKDPNALADERPQHTVCITHRYWLDQFDVTNAAYDAFVKTGGGYTNDLYWSADGLNWKKANSITNPVTCTQFSSEYDQPRICVNYYEAEAYAKWRGGKLPTEAEWEYAARGTDGRLYPWGDTFDPAKANVNSPVSKTTAVNTYPAGKSWVNAYDMSGNVFQWVSDWYSDSYYSTSPTNDPVGPISGSSRALRGGSWLNFVPVRARATYRGDGIPVDHNYNIGFRVVIGVAPNS